MAFPRAIPLLLAFSGLLLAGCTSPGADGPAAEDPAAPVPTDGVATAPPAGGEPAAPPATQEDDLAWALGTHGCAEPPPAWEALAHAFSPELDGVAYQSMAIDPATRGGDYDVAFALAPGTFAVSVVFWSGAVGPDGAILEVDGDRYTMALTGITISGGVPRQADFVTVASCGPAGSTAHYFAEKLRGTLGLL